MNILKSIFYNNYLLLIILIFSTSCLQEPAKIINRSNVKFNKNNQYNQEKYRNVVQKKSDKNDLPSTSSENKNDEILVQKGDTLYSISKKNNIPLRDIIESNNLEPPYNLKVGTALKIPSANFHESRDGDTLYSISRMYDMKVNDVIALNNLKFPYSIYPGDKIKIMKKIDENKIISDKKTEKNPQNIVETKIKPADKSKEITDKKHSKEIEKYGFKPSEVRAEEINRRNNPTDSRTAQNIINPTKNEIVETKLSINKPIDKDSIKKIANKANHFSWPVRGEIISKFGPKSAGLYNDGINIKAPEGKTVSASEDGIVAYVGNELKGYGNLVIIKHSGGWISAYAHLKNSTVERGQKIIKGQKIGNVGNSGKVKFPQLYFGLRKGRDAVNPENYL